MFNQDKQIGGEPIPVRDCYVWAEIHYLDSATDYREFLPEQPVAPSIASRHEIVMLDSSSSNPLAGWALVGMFLLISGLLCYDLLTCLR